MGGIDWVRPGPNGTHYPEKCNPLDLEINEKADIRLRTMCTEGALKIENVTDMIEWLPKVGFNSYYIQDNICYMFFRIWHNHVRSTVKEPEGFDPKVVEEYFNIMVREVKRRGLLLQRKGHGWNMWPFGIADSSYADGQKEHTVPEGYLDLCGDNEKGDALRDEAIHLSDVYEDKLQPVFNCHFFNRMTKERIELDGLGEFVGQ